MLLLWMLFSADKNGSVQHVYFLYLFIALILLGMFFYLPSQLKKLLISRRVRESLTWKKQITVLYPFLMSLWNHVPVSRHSVKTILFRMCLRNVTFNDSFGRCKAIAASITTFALLIMYYVVVIPLGLCWSVANVLELFSRARVVYGQFQDVGDFVGADRGEWESWLFLRSLQTNQSRLYLMSTENVFVETEYYCGRLKNQEPAKRWFLNVIRFTVPVGYYVYIVSLCGWTNVRALHHCAIVFYILLSSAMYLLSMFQVKPRLLAVPITQYNKFHADPFEDAYGGIEKVHGKVLVIMLLDEYPEDVAVIICEYLDILNGIEGAFIPAREDWSISNANTNDESSVSTTNRRSFAAVVVP